VSTGFVFDERCLEHRNPDGEGPAWVDQPPWERPQRLVQTLRVLRESGLLERLVALAAREATDSELATVHTREHVARVRAAAQGPAPAELGHDAWAGPGTHPAAWLAVGALLCAVDAVLAQRVQNAYVLARPPGHHAGPEQAMGFCLFNATAVAARHAQREHGLGRVAIVDWDVHHGNGTEAVFIADPSVLTVSLHQDGLYPARSGAAAITGEDDGRGANLNVPLPAGTGDAGYAHALSELVLPALRAFEPDLILVGAGQDAAATDPLGRMSLTAPGFGAMAEWARSAASELCGGRLICFQEGGYAPPHLAVCVLAIVEALAGVPARFPQDPVGADVPLALRDVERAAVADAARAHRAGVSPRPG